MKNIFKRIFKRTKMNVANVWDPLKAEICRKKCKIR